GPPCIHRRPGLKCTSVECGRNGEHAAIMTPRLWLIPLAGLILAGALSPAHAQLSRGLGRGRIDEPRQSHRPVDNGLEDVLRPEEMLAQRLKWQRERKSREDERAEQLLNDEI